MRNFICRWFVRTFGPINQVERFIRNNANNKFDSGRYQNTITNRWVPDEDKRLEIIETIDVDNTYVEVYLNTKMLLYFDDALDIGMFATKAELEYLYANICGCFDSE